MKKICYSMLLLMCYAQQTLAQGDCATTPWNINFNTLGACTSPAGTYAVSSTNNSGTDQASCGLDNSEASWITVTLPADANSLTLTWNDWGGCSGFFCATDITLALFSDCSGTVVPGAGCIDVSGSVLNLFNFSPYRIDGLTGGATYHIRISEEDNQNGEIRGLTLNTNQLITSSASCSSLSPICSDACTNFLAAVSGTDAQVGNDYDCLTSQPDPAWFYIKIGTAGSIDLSLSGEDDIDFALWGPYTTLALAQGACGSYPAPIDCSFSPSATESANIPASATVGQVYVLMITNYAAVSQYITVNQTSGTGTTDCSILLPCAISSIETSIGTCDNNGTPSDGSDDFNVWTVTVNYTDAPTTGTLGVSLVGSTIFSGTTSVPVGSLASATSHTFTLNVDADATNTTLIAQFSDATNCNFTLNNQTGSGSCVAVCNATITPLTVTQNVCTGDVADFNTALATATFSAGSLTDFGYDWFEDVAYTVPLGTTSTTNNACGTTTIIYYLRATCINDLTIQNGGTLTLNVSPAQPSIETTNGDCTVPIAAEVDLVAADGSICNNSYASALPPDGFPCAATGLESAPLIGTITPAQIATATGGNATCYTPLSYTVPNDCPFNLCPPCNISIVSTCPGACNNNATIGNASDDTYSISIAVAFEGKPSTGNLVLSLDGVAISTVGIALLNGPYYHNFTINVPADAAIHTADVAFSNDATCTTSLALAAVASCSPPACSPNNGTFGN